MAKNLGTLGRIERVPDPQVHGRNMGKNIEGKKAFFRKKPVVSVG